MFAPPVTDVIVDDFVAMLGRGGPLATGGLIGEAALGTVTGSGGLLVMIWLSRFRGASRKRDG